MAKHTRTYWTNKIELSPKDAKRLSYFISEELHYYNKLVSGLAGPIRSMPEAVQSLARLEPIVRDVARNRSAPAKALAKSPQASLLGPLHDRIVFLLGLMALDGTLHADVRAAMAVAIVRESSKLAGAFMGEGASHLVEALLTIEGENKRHVQIPRSAIKVVSTDKEADEIVLKLPYFEENFTVGLPSGSWNYAFVRVDHSGQVTLDLSQEDSQYVLRKVDRAPSTKRPVSIRRD